MQSILASEGFWILALAALVAGLVRGFTGFGTAMVYLPVAGQILSPFEALTTLIIMDLVGPLPNVPRALREGHPRDIIRLAIGAMLALPLGVLVLSMIAPEVFRYGVSLIALFLLLLLISGFRYRRALSPPMVFGTGAVGGFLAGSVGLPGPPVIMLYMASDHRAAVIRANTMIYLLLCDVLMLVVMSLGQVLVPSALAIGAVLILPYLAGNVLGGVLFRPGYERVYRSVAYLVIALSAANGLPFFD